MKKLILQYNIQILLAGIIIIILIAFINFVGIPVDDAEKFTWHNLLNH